MGYTTNGNACGGMDHINYNRKRRYKMSNQITEDLDLCHKEVAKYVGKDVESMRQLKRKWESTATGLWVHYVRSYKWNKEANNA